MNQLSIFITLTFLLLNCNKSEVPILTDCDQIGVVDNGQFRNAPRDPFEFVSGEITEDCLEVTVRYGGGCGGATFQLIGEDSLNLSLPPQRTVLISLEDKDNCEAIVIDTISFDLTAFRVDNSNEVDLLLDGISRTPIRYEY